jgi:hypothetical protein
MSRGQVFTTDFIIGLLLTLAAVLSVVFLLPTDDVAFSDDGERIAVLMTEGVPANWNNTTVIVPGFLSNDRFNETKIAAFAALPEAKQKQLLGIRSDYSITFTMNGTVLPLCTTCGAVPASYKELLPMRRIALLGPNVTMMEVRLYQ